MSKYYENELLKRKIDLLPDRPGSYQMLDKDKTVIYVGKAKSLLKRVKQYFTRPQVGKVQRMVDEIEDFNIIETNSEKEAFLLEISLIQKYYPKYNILLKDGKSYPFISLKKKGDPYLKISRNDKDKNFYHYGPFPSSKSCWVMIDLLNKIYPLRKCNVIPKKPCMYYYLGQCLGPCINKIDEKDYKDIDASIKKFLNGDVSEVVNDLTKKMKDAAENLEFEKANDYKITIDSIKHVIEKQKVMVSDHIDRDVIAYSVRDGYIAFIFLTYRKGVLLGKYSFIEHVMDDIPSLFADVIFQYYSQPNNTKPKEIIIPEESITSLLSEALNIKVYVPKKGKKKDMLNMAILNSKQSLDEHFLTARLEDDNLKLLEELQEKLALSKTPLNIELYDNSHLQGSDAVGVMVKYINGEPSRKDYRKYIIRSENKKDDLSSMHEVMSRRLARLKEENYKNKPDLIICDGGENQVKVTLDVLQNYPESGIKVCGLAKNDKHETDSLIDGESGEVIPLDKKSNLFFFLMRMQDEVHRYAITFFRKNHQKSMFATFYDDIKGIGKKKKMQLLDLYPTLESLQAASFDEIKNLVGEICATNIINKLKGIER